VDQLTSRILAVDASTLAVTATLDPGLGDNAFLQVDDLVWDDARGTLFLSQGDQNVLVEVDPSTGTALQTWHLGGGALVDESGGGRLMVGIAGDALITLRTADGTFTRVEPDVATPTAVSSLTADEVTTLAAGLLLPALYVTEDGSTAFAGGFAVSTADLSRTPERDLDATRVVGELSDGTLLAWQADPGVVIGVEASGATVTSATLATTTNDPEAIYAPDWDGRLVYAVMSDARIVTTAVPPPGWAP
jgi:hypothetical protein